MLHEDDNEQQPIDANNYKGIYAEGDQKNNKYIDPINGAHFEFHDMCKRLSAATKQRALVEYNSVAHEDTAPTRNGNIIKSKSSFKPNPQILMEMRRRNKGQISVALKKPKSTSFAFDRTIKKESSHMSINYPISKAADKR